MKTEYNYEDQSLLLAIKNGNEKAFDTLFRKYYPMYNRQNEMRAV